MSPTPSQSIARNTGIMIASQLVTWISSFVLMMFLPRYLGGEEYGRLFLAISVTTIIETVIHFGGQYHITKAVSLNHEQAPHVLVNSIVIRVFLWILSMGAVMAFVVFAAYPPTTINLILILAASKLWEGIAGVARSCFQGFEQMGPPSLSVILERMFLMCMGVGALLMGASTITIAVVMAASTLLRCFTMMTALRRFLPRIPRIDWSQVHELLRQGTPYFLWSAFAVIYYRIDAVMLSLMTPDVVVGWYGAAYRVFDILMFLPSIYTIALLPVISRLSHQGPSDVLRTTRQGIECMIIAGIPIGALVFHFSDSIIPFLFGPDEYGQSVVLIKLFAVGLVLVYVDFVLGTAVVAADKQRTWSLVSLCAIPINIGLNYVLIPHFQEANGNGGIGAAIATTITEAFIMGSAIVMLSKDLFRFSWAAIILKSVMAAFVMTYFVQLLQRTPLHWIATASIGVGVYVSVLVSLLILTRFKYSTFDTMILFGTIQRFLAPLRRSIT